MDDHIDINDEQKQKLDIWYRLRFAWSNRNHHPPNFYYPGVTEENFAEIVKLEARKFLAETTD